jgi:hypothetical protein
VYETVSRRQLRKGDRPWEGSWRQDLRADEQKPHTRRDPRASQHNMAKPDWHEGNVNAAVARGKFTHLIWGDLPGIGWGRTLA